MATTITVREITRKKLKKLKERRGAKSFDQILSEMADRELGIPDSLFGKAKGLSSNFEREHEERL